MGKLSLEKFGQWTRFLIWAGLFAGIAALGTPLGCGNDDIGDLLASGAIGSPGGAVRADNGAALLVPEFSLNAVYRFELLEVEHSPPANHNAVSLMIEVTPADISYNESIPASLILPLKRDRIPADRSIWQIQAFQRVEGTWKALKGVIDDGNSTVTIPITSSGVYAAFLGPAPPPAEPEPEPPGADGEPSADGEPTADAGGDGPVGEPSPEPPADTTTDAASEPTPEAEPTTEPTSEPTSEPTTDAGNEATPDAPKEPGQEPPPERTEPTPDR